MFEIKRAFSLRMLKIISTLFIISMSVSAFSLEKLETTPLQESEMRAALRTHVPKNPHSKKKIYLITAASSGLGSSISETLAEAGYDLILAGKDQNKLTLLKKKLEDRFKGKFSTLIFDYNDLHSIRKMSSSLKTIALNLKEESEGKIDGLVLIPARSSVNTQEIPTAEEWKQMVELIFINPMELIQNLTPRIEQDGSVVIISGLTSVYFIPEYMNTNVIRKMWTAETKNLSYQLAKNGIRVNAISPGVILSEYNLKKVQDRAYKAQKTIAEQLEFESSSIPLKRYGEPKDVANSVAFLLSDNARHITGTNLVIDGGLSKAY